MDDRLKEYREHLVSAGQKAIETYDRTLLTLSGGALALSLAFIRDIAPAPVSRPKFLLWAWVLWVVALLITVGSFYISHLALTKAMAQVDDETIHERSQGGRWTTVVKVLNPVAGLAFMAGVVLIVCFAYANLKVTNG